MWFDDSGEYLQGAEFCPSPNFDERPEGESPRLIVVHGISLPPGQFGSISVQSLFLNQLSTEQDPYYSKLEGVKVSAHFFIRRGGDVVQFVCPSKRAWHAGVSEYLGQSRCNDFSIGIELEGTDGTPYTAIQYQQLAQLIKALHDLYPRMPRDAVVGHSEIAPGRKTDPGPYFMWETVWRLLEIKKPLIQS